MTFNDQAFVSGNALWENPPYRSLESQHIEKTARRRYIRSHLKRSDRAANQFRSRIVAPPSLPICNRDPF